MPGHVLALVPGDAVTEELRQGLPFRGQQGDDALSGPVVGNLHEQHKAGDALDQRGDL
jgi:hypothetical protein